jgi:hypothetical protein
MTGFAQKCSRSAGTKAILALTEGDDMPKTDYSDPEIKFPRLEVRIFTIDG